MRQAEAPFRWSGGLTIGPDIATSSLQYREAEAKPPRPSFRGRQDRKVDRVGLDAGNLDDKGFCRNFEFHALADSLAIPDAAGGDRAEKFSILHHIDPAASREADGVSAGLRRALECRKAGKATFLRGALRRRGQL